MPLTAYQRGKIWWAKGRVEYNGRAIGDYIRESTGALTEAGARDWIEEKEERERRRYLLGDEAALTFNDAVLLYPAKPKEAGYLIPICREIGRKYLPISPTEIRDLGRKLYPDCSTDTWKRQVISPVSAVINNAHDLGKCAPIKIKGYTTQQRIDQDARRGKHSRPERKAGSWEWLDALRPFLNPYIEAGNDFMFETGARISQAVALEPKDLDLQNGRVWLSASKGHPAQWVSITPEMVATLANLKPRSPHNRKEGYRLSPRVFGYANRFGYTAALRNACKRAGIEYLSPHQLGRHGFYTELTMRKGVNPMIAAKAGRWSGHELPNRIYAHTEGAEDAIRAEIRTRLVQSESQDRVKSLIKRR